jgi:putative peptidoglycan lipid II flippase
VSVINSILYALKKFTFPSFLPMLFNICLICGIIFFKRYFQNYILVISVLAAGAFQFVFALGYLRYSDVHLKIDFIQSFKDREIVRMAKLFIPRVWSSVVYHLNVFIDTIFSSLSWIVGEGALAAVYYANRIVQLPLALIGISISRVAIVDLSGFHKDNNLKDFKELFIFSLRNILFFIIPIMCVFLCMSRELLEILFYRGNFDVHSLQITASTLFFYALGLFFFCGIKLLVNAFYSLKDTFTPAKTSSFSLILNVLLSGTLMFPLKIGGVALASSIAAMVNYCLLYRLLIRRIGPMNWGDTPRSVLKLSLLGLTAGFLLKVTWLVLPYNKYIKLFVGFILSGGVFLLLGTIFKVEQLKYFKRWILKKR